MTQSAHKKYIFGTEFSEDGNIIRNHNHKTTFTAEDIEVEKKAAYEQGKMDTIAQAQKAMLGDIGNAARTINQSVNAETQKYRDDAITLALIIAKQLSMNALENFPHHAIDAVLQTAVSELRTAPHIIITVPTEEEENIRQYVDEMTTQQGLQGTVIVKGKANVARSTCAIDWGDGSAIFDPGAIEEKIISLVKDHLTHPNGRAGDAAPPENHKQD